MPLGGRGEQTLIVYLLFAGLTTVSTLLRVYTKVVITKQFGTPDALAVLAWALFSCFYSFAIKAIFHGSGQHTWDIHSHGDLVLALKYWWLCEPFYVLSNMMVKASIAIMLLRLIMEPIQRVVVYVVSAVYQLYSAAFCLMFLLQCMPSVYFYKRFDGTTDGHCVPVPVMVDAFYAYSALSCVTDWTLSILPCVVVWNLIQMPKREKVLCAIILAMGAIASFATIARMPYVHTIGDTGDFLWATTDVVIWSCTETGVAITACSCATLRPLLRQWFGLSKDLPASSPHRTVSGRSIRPIKRRDPHGFTDLETSDTEVVEPSPELKSVQ